MDRNDTEFLLLLFILFIFREPDIWVEYNIVMTFPIFTYVYTCAFLLASLVLQASAMKRSRQCFRYLLPGDPVLFTITRCGGLWCPVCKE